MMTVLKYFCAIVAIFVVAFAAMYVGEVVLGANKYDGGGLRGIVYGLIGGFAFLGVVATFEWWETR